MAGYRFESTITFEFPGDYDRIEVDDAPTWGVALGYGPNPNWEFELQYSYTKAPARAIGANPVIVNQSFDLGLHDFQLGALGYLASAQEKLRPYVELSLGTTLINTGEGFGNTAHFSLAVALGLKYYFNDAPGAARRSPLHPGLSLFVGRGRHLALHRHYLLGHGLALPAAGRPARGPDVSVLTGGQVSIPRLPAFRKMPDLTPSYFRRKRGGVAIQDVPLLGRASGTPRTRPRRFRPTRPRRRGCGRANPVSTKRRRYAWNSARGSAPAMTRVSTKTCG